MPSGPTTIANATHSSHLDVMTGVGAMVCPLDSHDLHVDGMDTLNSAGWDDMVRRLARMGWAPLIDDETQDLSLLRRNLLGQSVVTLYENDPVVSTPNLQQMLATYGHLRSSLRPV